MSEREAIIDRLVQAAMDVISAGIEIVYKFRTPPSRIMGPFCSDFNGDGHYRLSKGTQDGNRLPRR